MKNKPQKFIGDKIFKSLDPEAKIYFIELLERFLSRIKKSGALAETGYMTAAELKYCEAEAIPPLAFLKAKSSRK